MAMLAAALITAAVTGTCPNGYERGFAKGGEQNWCFQPLAGHWGWYSEMHRSQNSYTLPLYSETGGCDHTQGTVIGKVEVKWIQHDRFTIKFVETTSETFKYVGFKISSSRLYDNCGASVGSWSKREWTATTGAWRIYIFAYAKMCDVPDTPTPPTPAPCTPALETSPEVTVTAGSTQRPSGNAVAANMLGWSIDNGAQVILDQFADVYKLPGMKAYFPEQDKALAAGAAFHVECPENCEGRGCEVIVTTYHCVPCSSQSNGHLPALMTADGWEAGSCAPRFRQPSKRHQMVAFRTFVAAGGSVTTPATEKPLSNVAVYVRTGAVDCEALTTNAACSATTECRWSEGECVSNWCPTPPTGLPPVCEPCAPTGLQ